MKDDSVSEESYVGCEWVLLEVCSCLSTVHEEHTLFV